MKNKLLAFLVFLLFVSLAVSGKANSKLSVKRLLSPPSIDLTDKIIFDMGNATITGNYVDVPVYFISNDSVLSVDFAIRFDNIKLTFDTVINHRSYLTENAHYNPFDSTLRLTSNASDINNFDPIENNTPLFSIRFHFNVPNPCNNIYKRDFQYVDLVRLNGDACSYEIRESNQLDFISNDNGIACIGDNSFKTINNQIANDTIFSWFWDFGNGTTSNLPEPVVNYSLPATYTVTLIAQTGVGCADTAQKTIIVNDSPQTSFTYAPDCSTGNITFIDLSSISLGIITNWNWNFGDSIVSHQINPIHNYDLGGTYTVSLTTVSDSGCTSVSSQTVPVDLLSANFRPIMGCVGEPMNFSDNSTSTPASGPITDYLWYFGDAGTSSTLQNPSHIYVFSGTYQVRLKVSNLNCSDSISKTVIIENKPVVRFTEDRISGCMPLTVNFSDSSTFGSTPTYLWKFDNAIDTTASPNISHTYTANGLYSVKHYVLSAAGCIDSLEKTSYIDVFGVTASFIASPEKVTLPAATVTFSNHSNSFSNWTWNFGDSIYSSDRSPQHTYVEAGVYTVCLMGLNPNGCASNYCDTITVENPNTVAFPQAFTPNGDNANDILRVRGGPVEEMELRIFNEWGNQVFISNEQSYGWDGTYNGAPQAVGVYEFTIKGKTLDNEAIDMHGVVNLIR